VLAAVGIEWLERRTGDRDRVLATY